MKTIFLKDFPFSLSQKKNKKTDKKTSNKQTMASESKIIKNNHQERNELYTKILLNNINTHNTILYYKKLLKKKKSKFYLKIKGAINRCFINETHFFVDLKAFIRILNIFQHKHEDSSSPFYFLQGMEHICGFFLNFFQNEIYTFISFDYIITELTPTYWLEDYIGVRAGCNLTVNLLKMIDYKLYKKIHIDLLKKKKNLNLKDSSTLLYFPIINSIYTSPKPLTEVYKLWDFLLVYGLHFNILLIISQLIFLRKKIFKFEDCTELFTELNGNLKKWPKINAEKLISLTIILTKKYLMNTEIFGDLSQHMVSLKIAQKWAEMEIEMEENQND